MGSLTPALAQQVCHILSWYAQHGGGEGVDYILAS
jgi:hypothetical protein